MAVIVDDPAERIAVFWNCAARGYEEIPLQKPVDVFSRPSGTADHSAGPYFLFESEAAIAACCTEVVGCGAVGVR